MTLLWIFIGGACGTALRAWACARATVFPWATVAVNIVGSLLAGWLSARGLPPESALPAITGFCGGLTTYSTFAVQTWATAGRSRRLAFAYVALNLFGGLSAAVVGFQAGV